MTTRPVSDMITFLVGSRFPDQRWLRDPNRPRVGRSGENAPELSEEQRNAAMAELEAYEAELNAKSADEVHALYDAERRRHAEEARRKRRARAEAEERSRFFNRPRANADFVHWSKAPYWTIDEGVALLLGRAPEVVDWESVRDYAHASPFARQYAQLRDLALRARESGQLALRTEPRAFLEWAKRTGIAYPCGLEEHVESATRAVRTEVRADPAQTSLRGVTIEKTLLTRERDTVLKMLGGMALQKYGYNPKATRNAAIAAIVADLDAAGVHVDADTVRKWIKEAVESMPREALEDRIDNRTETEFGQQKPNSVSLASKSSRKAPCRVARSETMSDDNSVRRPRPLPKIDLVRLSSIIAPRGPIPVSKSTWWAGVKSGRFPKPVKLGPRITA